MNAQSAADPFLFDFAVQTDFPAGEIVNDGVMGGSSTSRFHFLPGSGAVFTGVVSLENNGGFASVRLSPVRPDLSGHAAFVVRLRGDGRRYKFTVRTAEVFNTPVYQCAFTTKRGAWTEVRLPFKDFVPTFRGRELTEMPPLQPAQVSSLGFLISDRQDGPFQLEVAWIKVSPDAGKWS